MLSLHLLFCLPSIFFCNICPKQNSVCLYSFRIQPILTSWISLMSYESYNKIFSRYFIFWQTQRSLRCRLNSAGTNFCAYFLWTLGLFRIFVYFSFWHKKLQWGLGGCTYYVGFQIALVLHHIELIIIE